MSKNTVTIDLSGINSKVAIHQAFKQHLGFPDWYGPSWDALWDAIIAVVEMPDEVVLLNLAGICRGLPKGHADTAADNRRLPRGAAG
jgi:RNAse (barnase) inhibitor barstar